jgi:endonuclease/exonuclease/phosphatase family metal-dependent hydrolase
MFKWLYKRLYNQYEYVEYAGNKKHTSLLKNLNWFSNGLVIWYDKSKYIKGFTKYITEEHNHPEKFLLVTTLISDKGFLGVVDTHYDSTYNHKRQMLTDKLNKVIKDAGHRVIVCGDFNASRNSNEVRNINLDYCVPSDGETQRTFNHFDETWAVIDFILSNNEIKEYEIVTKDYGVPYISDHYPITIEL